MPKSIALIAAVITTFAMAPASRAGTPTRARVQRVLDAVVPGLMKREGIPGMAVGVVVGGQSYVFDYGVASRATGTPVNGSTLFELGSISKTFTATLAALAEVDGRLSLSDPVGKFLPALKAKPFGAVTLLELGTHTSGGLPLYVPDGIDDDAALMRYLAAWKPACAAATCRVYSNIGIGMLGVVTAKAEGRPFVELMQQQVLGPLGMHHTWYRVPDDRMVDYAEGYTAKDQPIRMAPSVLDDEAYGVRTTAADMLRFVQANLRPDSAGVALGQAITVAQTGYFKAGPMTQGLIWERYPYPVALETLLAGNSPRMLFDRVPAERLTPPLTGHSSTWINKTGSTNGFGAYVAFIPAKGIGVVILANKSYPIEDRVKAAYAILGALDKRQRRGRVGQ